MSSSTATRAEGALTLSTGEHQMVQGTLAADTLDLDALHLRRAAVGEQRPQLGPAADHARRHCRTSTSICGSRRRASRSPTLKSAAPRSAPTCARASSISPSGNLRPSAARSKARSGSPSPMTASRRQVHLQFVDVDLENCLRHVFGIQRLAGRGNIDAQRRRQRQLRVRADQHAQRHRQSHRAIRAR